MKPVLLYCYDAYCGWCYGFSPVIQKIRSVFHHRFQFEVLPGGMILPEKPVHLSTIASYLNDYRDIEKLTGVKFGPDFLWHIENPDKTDWYPNSEKPAVALSIFREYFPEQQVIFATNLQQALFAEGRDLCDDEAYRHLLLQFNIPAQDFYSKLHSKEYQERANDEFALVKKLKVTGYPTVMIQASGVKFYMVSRGYSSFDTVKLAIDNILGELQNINP